VETCLSEYLSKTLKVVSDNMVEVSFLVN